MGHDITHDAKNSRCTNSNAFREYENYQCKELRSSQLCSKSLSSAVEVELLARLDIWF
jgi:hypothetical protein